MLFRSFYTVAYPEKIEDPDSSETYNLAHAIPERMDPTRKVRQSVAAQSLKISAEQTHNETDAHQTTPYYYSSAIRSKRSKPVSYSIFLQKHVKKHIFWFIYFFIPKTARIFALCFSWY